MHATQLILLHTRNKDEVTVIVKLLINQLAPRLISFSILALKILLRARNIRAYSLYPTNSTKKHKMNENYGCHVSLPNSFSPPKLSKSCA